MNNKRIVPEDVFEDLERSRRDGSLSQSVTKSQIKYQACLTYPGYIEHIDEHNNVTIGKWKNGIFIPLI